ncbi:heme/hemin ABC transporter substrate-binding protein [Granulosicoccus sp. 3-233]|uniref:heme/hemin ABC transporter substrate-binding protein n=1 Tax=Granulosicoccus sp. 3-233 TaxID=3417969 RepID=UPI003D33A57A
MVRLLRSILLLVSSLTLTHTAAAQADEGSPRLVSVAGSLTEILHALDLQNLLVGVDTTSQWPPAAAELPQVGYQRALSAEGILSLSPDTVLATADAGPPEVLQQLLDAGVRIEQFSRDYTIEGLYERIRAIARAHERISEAEQLIASIQDELDAVAQLVQGRTAPRVMFLLGVDAGSSMAAGNGTSADAMIALSGALNAMSDHDGYKLVNAESIIEAAPEFILVVQHDTDRNREATQQSVLALPGVALTPAGRHSRILVLDALRFLGFGPRTGQALQDLASQLFPIPGAQ